MIGRANVIKTFAAAATVISSLTLPAHSDPFSKKGGGYAGPPVEKHPPVGEKAYKAALDRIPTPDETYGPWGIARPAEPAKSGEEIELGVRSGRRCTGNLRVAPRHVPTRSSPTEVLSFSPIPSGADVLCIN